MTGNPFMDAAAWWLALWSYWSDWTDWSDK